MSKRALQFNVFLVMGAFGCLLIIARYSYHLGSKFDLHNDIKDFCSLFVAIGAAYLAYCFQRRQAFLLSLRELWKEMIEAKAEILGYTHQSQLDQASFGKAHRELSKCIDTVRGVYRNVGETDASVGLFPFEPLHDMRRSLEAFGWENGDYERQQETRRQVIQSWNALRCNFLKEFSTLEPRNPITRRGATDPRR